MHRENHKTEDVEAGDRVYSEDDGRGEPGRSEVEIGPDGYVPFDPVLSFQDNDLDDVGADAERASFYKALGAREGSHTVTERSSAVSLNWEDLCLAVKLEGGMCGRGPTVTKRILTNISGYVRPGQMLAIMGSSGAGKSTLLNMLAGRVPAGQYETSGELRVNGKPRDSFTFQKSAAYVEQEDRMFAELTVREQLEFSARLRLPRSMPLEKKRNRVEQVVRELGLSKCVDTMVGNAVVRGVSGGERKRVNIGIELVTDPSLILLDEPTSGLDAFQAQAVMLTMLRLARNGRTVVATIHQPRSQIFQMFDYLLLLSEGQEMYFGPAKEMVPYFAALRYPCPEYFNPADFAIDLVSLDMRTKSLEKQTRARIQFLADRFGERMQTIRQPLDDPLGGIEPAKPEKRRSILPMPFKGGNQNRRTYATRWPMQFALLFARAFKLVTRERFSNIARLAQTLIFSVLLGLIWLNTGRNSGDTHAIAGVLFFLLINQSFGTVFGVVFLFPLERGIVLRERTSKAYRVSAYFLGKSSAEFPRLVVFALLFSVITYWMVGLYANAGAFFLFVVIVVLTAHTAESLTLMASAGAKSPQAAAAFTPILIVTSLLFGGFFIGPNVIPVWLSWLRYVSFIYYAFAAVMTNEFNHLPSGPNNPLQIYSINSFGIGGNIGFLIMLDVAFRFIAYAFLLRNGPRFAKNL
ncbi:hypothetical protein CDCA_CDCA06G1763 [Cyanidium caldarium]|uniref:Probable ATP-dependent transporter ycf16 n=1 Tax=Cyanidium caldarium TaxID=2771 RepID=A0AAV9ITX5_CYACA|nr:hypothetical protein CDCA_CDCA06G1763 [Cyanidium caldarium]